MLAGQSMQSRVHLWSMLPPATFLLSIPFGILCKTTAHTYFVSLSIIHPHKSPQQPVNTLTTGTTYTCKYGSPQSHRETAPPTPAPRIFTYIYFLYLYFRSLTCLHKQWVLHYVFVSSPRSFNKVLQTMNYVAHNKISRLITEWGMPMLDSIKLSHYISWRLLKAAELTFKNLPNLGLGII